MDEQRTGRQLHRYRSRIVMLENALRNMTANFRTSLLLVSDPNTRELGMDLVREAEKLLRRRPE